MRKTSSELEFVANRAASVLESKGVSQETIDTLVHAEHTSYLHETNKKVLYIAVNSYQVTGAQHKLNTRNLSMGLLYNYLLGMGVSFVAFDIWPIILPYVLGCELGLGLKDAVPDIWGQEIGEEILNRIGLMINI